MRLSEETMHDAAAQTITKMLNHPEYTKRSFETFQKRFGATYDDEKLRALLLSVGAVRYQGEGGKECWGLLTRNGEG